MSTVCLLFSADLIDLMSSSSSSLVSNIGTAAAPATESRSSKQPRPSSQTVSSKFSSQLQDLVTMLDTTGLHFVRCIKPNPTLEPQVFAADTVLHQLRCCGVLEVARVAQAGYPTRYKHQEFVERYRVLLPAEQQGLAAAAVEGDVAVREAVQQLLGLFGVADGEYELGSTTVFFKTGKTALFLAWACSLFMQTVLGLWLYHWLCYPAAQCHAEQPQSLHHLQASLCYHAQIGTADQQLAQCIVAIAGVLGQVEDTWAKMQSSALKIQTTWRMYTVRKQYLEIRSAAVAIQSNWRARAKRAEINRRVKAAVVIQRGYRSYVARSKVRTLQVAMVVMYALCVACCMIAVHLSVSLFLSSCNESRCRQDSHSTPAQELSRLHSKMLLLHAHLGYLWALVWEAADRLGTPSTHHTSQFQHKAVIVVMTSPHQTCCLLLR